MCNPGPYVKACAPGGGDINRVMMMMKIIIIIIIIKPFIDTINYKLTF
jgi:hypothetical protein